MATIDQNPEHLEALAKEVSRVSGLDVTCTRDCEVLGDELRAFDGRFAVSTSTLRRFFGLIPKKGNYSTNTLNTLARYVGYASFRAWSQRLQPGVTFQKQLEDVFEPIAENFREKSPRTWSNQEAQAQVERFVKRFGNPKDFHLTAREFRRLKEAVFNIFQRGALDMALWLKFAEHPHLLRFVVEQFPPLDYLASFGRMMVDSYLEQATSPGDVNFGESLKSAGLVAQDESWDRVLATFPTLTQLNPGIHPLVQSRQIGIAMLAESEGQELPSATKTAVELALEGLQNERSLWPRWANQSCYFAFNLADWAILSGERDVVLAISKNIDAFQSSQDWYNRDTDLDTILNLRQVWNWIELGQKEKATALMQNLDWMSFESIETRTLSLWHHSARWILKLAPGDVCKANIEQASAITQYHGLKRRISALLEKHL